MRQFPRAPFSYDVIISMPYHTVLARGIDLSEDAILIEVDEKLIDRDLVVQLILKIPKDQKAKNFNILVTKGTYLRHDSAGEVVFKLIHQPFSKQIVKLYIQHAKEKVVDFLKSFETKSLSDKDRAQKMRDLSHFLNIRNREAIHQFRSRALYFFNQLTP